MTVRRGLIVATLLALSAASCNESPPTTPNPTPVAGVPSAPALTEKDILEAVAFRERFGLRADRFWVISVAANPAAQVGIPEFGLPLMPDEYADLMGRHWDLDLLQQVQRYGELFPEDFAGAWVNLTASGVTAAFKDRLERHGRALANLVPPGSIVEVKRVAWSLADLDDFATRVEAEQAWFDSVGVTFAVDQEQIQNDVRV